MRNKRVNIRIKEKVGEVLEPRKNGREKVV